MIILPLFTNHFHLYKSV